MQGILTLKRAAEPLEVAAPPNAPLAAGTAVPNAGAAAACAPNAPLVVGTAVPNAGAAPEARALWLAGAPNAPLDGAPKPPLVGVPKAGDACAPKPGPPPGKYAL